MQIITEVDAIIVREQYFDFEDDFLQDNIRCIPMMVRFKLDAACIKLKLSEWSSFTVAERNRLTTKPCHTPEEVADYRSYLYELILMRTGNEPVSLPMEQHPAWADLNRIEIALLERAKHHNWEITIQQWRGLNHLQRFALLKLYRPGHESKNFPKAMHEFGLVDFQAK